jgi:benzoyl-CoA reductase/2-hydroxyglutaryl-CoA dehydratase subunit BcrC/BadD/HgdB
MSTVGITALVPPELIFACGKKPCDINNYVPKSRLQPTSKLCAWTAIWRDMILKGEISVDSLVVVAGGDCHNALVDGQKVSMKGLSTFFLFYPFEDDPDYLKDQLEKLSIFLGDIAEPKLFKEIKNIKKRILEVDQLRINGKIPAEKAFEIMVSASDFQGDVTHFKNIIEEVKEGKQEYKSRIALLGVPPIYSDFHILLKSLGIHVVYDELPYEFARLSGENIKDLAKNYCNYTFARSLEFRLDFLEKELEKRKVDGVIHYTQFACHHLLEDDVLRKSIDYPFLTIQGDLPGKTPKQAILRLEAFSEMLENI